jgi:hypothetical protein
MKRTNTFSNVHTRNAGTFGRKPQECYGNDNSNAKLITVMQNWFPTARHNYPESTTTCGTKFTIRTGDRRQQSAHCNWLPRSPTPHDNITNITL